MRVVKGHAHIAVAHLRLAVHSAVPRLLNAPSSTDQLVHLTSATPCWLMLIAAMNPCPRGYFDFPGTYSGESLADFLRGYTTVAQRSTAFGGSTQPGASVYAGDFQDDWRVTPRLTINVGVRYEVQTQYEDRDGNHAHRHRSAAFSFGRFTERCRTPS